MLSDEQIEDLLEVGNPTDEEKRLIRMGWDAARNAQPTQAQAGAVPLHASVVKRIWDECRAQGLTMWRSRGAYSAPPPKPPTASKETSMGLFNRLFRRKPEYIYGTAGNNHRPARKHKSGRVEFVMWKAGEHGHPHDYWFPYHPNWWPTFKQGGQHAE